MAPPVPRRSPLGPATRVARGAAPAAPAPDAAWATAPEGVAAAATEEPAGAAPPAPTEPTSTEDAPDGGGGSEQPGGDAEPPEADGDELEAMLEDGQKWTIFEDVDDEVQYLRRRADVLQKGLVASRAEVRKLHAAGAALQDAYEGLQAELRQVVGDAAYWQALSEAYAEDLAAMRGAPAPAAGAECPPAASAQDAAPSPATAAAEPAAAPEPASAQGAAAAPAEVAVPPELAAPMVASSSLEAAGAAAHARQEGPGAADDRSRREALRAAAAEAAAHVEASRWRRLAEQRGQELVLMRTVGCASASPTGRAAYPSAGATLQDFASASCTSSSTSLPSAGLASGEGASADQLARTPPRCHPLDLGAVLGGSPPGSVRSAKAPSSAGRSSTVLGLHPGPSSAALCGSASARSLRSERSSRSPCPDVSVGGVKRALFQPASRSGSGPRRFGPGSAPKRCPGLGAPMRRVSSSGSRASLGGARGDGRAELGGGGRTSLGGAGGPRLSVGGGAPTHGQL
ncbi:unnamed protein product [Prorocentrum cordatum]|uniref:Uncharacterized protein n=1 Tax=Prorocentrum cordatum TaxID=2364126 RepID=A0ABN9REL0_9DINO|nr:unnamed protein product [Polarella glacialis]